MKQDMNNSFAKALRAVFVGTLMFMTWPNAMAQGEAQSTQTTGVVVHGNVFGGGNQADVKINTEVNMSTGTVEGNVYGGGNLGSVGTYTTSADMKTFTFTANTGTCNVTIDNGSIGTGVSMSQDGTFANGNVYGAGKGEADTYWCEKAMVYKTNVTINGGTVNGTVYGGGQIGRVENDATVIIGVETPTNNTPAPIIAGNVFGAGAGKETHGYSALLRGDAKLTIQGNARVGLNVYGGGEEASVGRFKIVGGRPSEPDNDGSGDCTVNVRGGAVIGTNTDDNITDKGNVFGTCKGVAAPATFTAYDKEYKSMQAVVQKAPVGDSGTAWEYVEGSTDYYWEYYPTLDAYQGFLNTLALTSHPVVTIGGMLSNETTGAVIPSGNPTVNGSVYGGGQRGITLGTVAVNIAGGTVNQDVYGGGALADTNKGNQTAEKYDVATVTVGETAVTGMYERSGAGTDESPYVYAVTEDTKAEDGKTYYTKAAQSSINTTTVNLTGGTIKGDAYGGGLGQKIGFNDAQGVIATKDVEAVVWGDINVTLGGNGGSTATSFYTTYEKDNDNNDVLKSGRVFGCNNLLGSPRGDVTVTVWTTVDGKNAAGETITKTDVSKKNSTTETDHTYRLAAVYGGGNLASYEASGKKAHVIIHGCENTSILTVYGGGNAAAVPETDVDVYSAYEIGALFGGGNGKDKYKKENTWLINPGADVNGNANTMVYGGTVHEAYGASNEKGTITGDVAIDVSNVNSDNCPLDVAKIVGAGKNADVNGNLILVMGCKPSTLIPLVYGGADNANVNGNVELTITSGNFTKVFGGNNAGGAIRGYIKLNIEETGSCETPITIDQLYLGGNEAAYSIYGYYVKTTTSEGDGGGVGASDETAILKNGKLQFMPRQSATDTHLPVDTYTFDEDQNKWSWTTSSISTFTPYDEPELNVISCTRINNVFGGGFGTGAAMYADPTVNINMIKGHFWDDQTLGVPKVMTDLGLNSSENPNGLGIIGNVYGGGNAADVVGNPTVNIGTAATVDLVSTEQTGVSVLGAYITGNVYGGGKGEAKLTTEEGNHGEAFLCAKAMVNGNTGTHVNMGNGMVRGNVYGGGEVGRVENNTAVTIGLAEEDVPEGETSSPVINGNVFGAGKGVDTHGYSALVRGTSTVIVQADAKVRGNVYGGGEIASVGKYKLDDDGLPQVLDDSQNPYSGYCYVTIKGNAEIGRDDMVMNNTTTGKPDDYGHVFGAGKGVLPYEFYTSSDAVPRHMDGIRQNDGSWVDHYKEYPAYNPSADLDTGYKNFIKSLALATQTVVTIEGNPFIKGSVYGGSENGFVQHDTHVVISGGQIGNGYVQMDNDGNYLTTKRSVNRRYTAKEWTDGRLFAVSDPDYTTGTDTELEGLVSPDASTHYYTSSLPECASWRYGAPHAPYDIFALEDGNYPSGSAFATAEGGRPTGSDGHTFYGNVFGGGSGYYPYKPGRWFEDAGAVYGNTQVDITGGHILTSIYGGNEMTNVSGTSTVNFGGTATLGVPRTLKQIDAHPVTCYLFGAGKGDQRVFFNKSTNVEEVEVNITGGRIYGSVFGGGEDGHVHRDVTMTINETDYTADNTKTRTKIGTWGTSYVDGNVFGGGRGFGGDAYTAGNVAGSVTMTISGGEMLGSIYGGGRLGSVGYGLFDEKTNNQPTPGYGEMRADADTEEGFVPEGGFTHGRGHIDITISGGTIGNTHEYIIPNATNMAAAGIPEADRDISKWNDENKYWNTWRTYHNIPKTEFDTTTGHLMHTKGGNVFAGGMGRFYQLDGSTAISAVDWWKLGNVKSTKLTITGGNILSNVYGGGELGMVQGGSHTSEDNKTVSTEIIISGGTIGTDIADYTFGSVFGGGYGSLIEKFTHTGGKPDSYPKYIAGRVKGSTEVTISGSSTVVKASVYGGGEMAAVGESEVLLASTDPVVPGETLTGENGAPVEANTYVIISGGTIGKAKEGTTYFGGAKMGNVYGGGSGHNNTVRSGHIYGNTNVTISDGVIYHNVYGGGAYGSVGDFTYHLDNTTKKVDGISGRHADRTDTGTANVTITGGTIGYDGKENGMVFGSSRGDINVPLQRDDHTAWVYDANVTIGTSATGTEGQASYVAESGPDIKGSVYGSGENGHVFNNTVVTVNGGTIGIDESTDPGYTVTSNNIEYSGAEYPYRGNVYGGGCGTDKYYSGSIPSGHTYNDGEGDSFNPLAGIVYGTTTVNITGGTVVHNVYGAGAMGSVGKTVTTTDNDVTTTTVSGGTTTIKVSGGTIGVDGTKGDGNVFGAARGDEDAIINQAALVKKNTNVSITGGTIEGNVYGGGELGCVGTFTVSQDMRTFTWQDTDGDPNTAANSDNKNTGVCNVTVDGSSAVINGHVYGAGKGKEDTFWCEKGIAYSTNVNISNGTVGTLDANNKLVDGTGNVYGGGEVGRVETDTKVNIGEGDGTAGGSSAPTIRGSVFGGGAGVETHGYSALVRGNTYVTVKGNAGVGHSVYGGGEIASVGRYGLDEQKMPSILQGGGYCYVKVQGYAQITDDVFGAGEGITPHFDKDNSDPSKRSRRMTLKNGWESLVGDARFEWDDLESESEYSTYLETLALATHPEVTIDGNATVSGSVFGGGELGLTKGSVIVNIQGGTIAEDVYGGGSLAHSNTTSTVETIDPETQQPTQTTVHPTTTVNLKGGTINRNVYGGGLGRLAKNAVNYTAEEAAAYNTEYNLSEGDADYKTTESVKVAALSAVEAKVYGNVSVKLNEPTTSGQTTTYGNCEVKGAIFGCNNLNGSPQAGVDVHIYKTVKKNDSGTLIAKPAKNTNNYEVTAVYGGGNLAAYYPDDETVREAETTKAYVTIDGCELTSIGSVYGGGNAASVPATEVVVNGTYEIGEAFGGGNGKDDISYDGTNYVTNPGANVGYRAYPEGTNLDGRASYAYGIGKAHITIYGGTVHTVYGGSNTKGNVRVESRTTLEELGQCDYNVGDAFGGGNNADQDGDAILDVGCITGLDIAYGGASNADVNGDVILNLTNGTYGRVFGGNNLGGAIRGSILVNIEETGCNPIVIGELYCGGNEAAYSVYGYNDDGTVKETGSNPVPDPVLNVKSFTSIGKIFGGGYGARAKMVASPTVNINVIKGRYSNEKVIAEGEKVYNFDIPSHESGAIGAIGSVFGGGNAAEVIGTPHVNIGTKVGEVIPLVSKPIEDSEGRTPSAVDWTPSYQLVTVEGVDIRDNVYGAGNNAQVTGNTEVVIGKNNDVKTYSFTSYSASNGGDVWSSGLAQTTGKYVTLGDSKLAEVEILTNGKYDEYVGKKFYVDPEGSGRLQLYNADKEATSLWVSIEPFAYKTYSFKSYGASSGGTEYSTGTAAPTGNFKEFDGTEYMQIVVLTNPGEASWVGKTFYVPANAETNGNARTQLHKANGDPVNVWVSIEL